MSNSQEKNDRFLVGKYPRATTEFSDLVRTVETYVLPGFIPEKPFISTADLIRTQGSCFAANIASALAEYGMNARILNVPEAFNSPKFNELYLQYALHPEMPFEHEGHAKVFPVEQRSEIARKITETSVYIFTFGVAPYVVDQHTGIPSIDFDLKALDRYAIHNPTVEETKATLTAIFGMVKRVNPSVKIIATISPVPLNRSSNHSSVVDDCISKSTLRAALAEVLAQPGVGVSYWPSFEIVRWLGAHIGPVFGADDGLARHVNKSIVHLIIELFLKYYAIGNK
jgi:hypothetical protein